MKIDYVYKDISKAKLTIAKDRWELKLPPMTNHLRYRSFVHLICHSLWNEEMFTRRGTFEEVDGKLQITMSVGKTRQDGITFKED